MYTPIFGPIGRFPESHGENCVEVVLVGTFLESCLRVIDTDPYPEAQVFGTVLPNGWSRDIVGQASLPRIESLSLLLRVNPY